MDRHGHKPVGNTELVAFHSQFTSVEITSQSVVEWSVRSLAHCEQDNLDMLSKHVEVGRG